jgi:hypothetical protein
MSSDFEGSGSRFKRFEAKREEITGHITGGSGAAPGNISIGGEPFQPGKPIFLFLFIFPRLLFEGAV